MEQTEIASDRSYDHACSKIELIWGDGFIVSLVVHLEVKVAVDF